MTIVGGSQHELLFEPLRALGANVLVDVVTETHSNAIRIETFMVKKPFDPGHNEIYFVMELDTDQYVTVSPVWSHIPDGTSFVPFDKWFDMPIRNDSTHAVITVYESDHPRTSRTDADDFVATIEIDLSNLTNQVVSVFENDNFRLVYSIVKSETD